MRSTLTHALRTAAPERPDGQLLDLFARHRDEEAFAAVVRRHGPMVLGVCCRLLGNRADADDAFQATFLVLARRAATLGRVEALAGWLHGVAVNAARKLRHMNARRLARERRAGPPPPVPSDDVERDELLAALDAEIARLPAVYRDAVVLCDLEGATRKEAARRLGCPEGTVAGRLARARGLLAKRLTDRGLIFAGGALAGLTAAVPPALLASAIEAATAGPTSARVAAATEGVMKAMLLNKIRAATAALVVAALAVTGVGVSRGPADEKPVPALPQPAAPAAKADGRRVTAFPLKKLKVAEVVSALAKALAGEGKSDASALAALAETYYRTSPRAADGAAGGVGKPAEALTVGSATLIPIEAENTLLVYADEATTRQVEEVLRKLGEPLPKVASRIAVTNVSAAEAAKVLAEVFGPGRAAFTAIPGEDALIVYATEIDTLTVRRLLGRAIDAPAAKPTPAAVPAPANRFPMAFQNESWEKVFQWYADVSGVPCMLSVMPTGTFTYSTPPGVTYSVAEITDILSDALMARGFIMLRREKAFTVHRANEKLPPGAVPKVAAGDLDRRARTELVQVTLPLTASKEFDDAFVTLLKQQLGPFGAVERSGPDRILLTETAGRAAKVRDVLAGLAESSRKGGASVARMQTIPLKHTSAAEVAEAIKKHFHPALKVAVTFDPAKNSVVIEGDPLALALLADMIRKLDEPPSTFTVIPLKHVAAQDAVQALRTTFAKPDQVRVASDKTANSVIVLQASPADLDRIKDVLRRLDLPPPPKPEVLRLKRASAQVIAEALNKAFGQNGQLRVTFDPANNSLVIQGAPSDVLMMKRLATAFDDASAPRGELEADVELLRERVAWAERMTKLGQMSASQLQAERAKLAAAEAKLREKK